MRKILYIFLTLSILSTGCSKEDDVQLTQEVTNNFDENLDENLYGIWKNVDDGSYTSNGLSSVFNYFRSFSSNGNWNSWTIENIFFIQTGELSSINTINRSSGIWWIEDNYLFTTEPNLSVYSYSLNNNTLILTTGDDISTWTKQ